MDLARRRAEAETRIFTLQQARGVALLDGKSFDNRELTALETELEAITAAEGEEARRTREAAVAAEKARLAGLQHKLDLLNGERLEIAWKAQKSAEELCEYIKLWLVMNADCARLVRTLNGKGGAGILDRNDTAIRISRLLANTLKPLTGLGRQFGLIKFPDAPLESAHWAETERKLTNPEIAAVLKGSDE
ncbi:hypothetical protein [Mesorhizobium sp.]|uniref:hypothetical protein n=1 Tax=Mesorhizobium sp. TaxID=1871066 RepID=UPI000FE80A19|nr:hypothetical protein [Mesorhizobium sp.]RWN11462.1 MAG: hypothetical protein EOR87_13015 [Mesorhizobium sp.]RWN19750.1 MAG: hypothetical protein EOR88_11550 [Mesorhizobium sp.]